MSDQEKVEPESLKRWLRRLSRGELSPEKGWRVDGGRIPERVLRWGKVHTMIS